MTERQAGSTTPKAHLIAAEVRRRIVEREWLQGERIPDEVELAVEFGAARATVNKALQLLADEGLLDRRRRAGTRIAINPVRKATFEIPIVREQIEGAGMSYGHRVMAVHRSPLPEDVALRLGMAAGQRLLHLRAVHYGDGRPFQYEDRWINPAALPGTEPVDFGHVNANEWLVRNAPYLRADMAFSAANADRRDARMLQTDPGQALLILQRTTWNEIGAITTVRVACHPGYRMTAAN
ncbi:GntR family transcriptional regulator, histidine utilization repressor [Paracoccus alcaliphilus]|uniref:GntR family transcriptional regulator, histidine utilization repressor n=1 Tax=Paracoccus alcaliphilus TaxID=34002 RepID=A0A1H8EW70_9RHOB|nr:UTRA domain-containing protein [Paracoccus alcaliphilus]WCR20121.1 UTRA domain-containing protein [Paracoccus alcaliphilus]SEN23891.1 GntR family transcriptional regulator, histidine utilization repressor [Paracoccus alcaliphilus]